jgi:hypothetical protein
MLYVESVSHAPLAEEDPMETGDGAGLRQGAITGRKTKDVAIVREDLPYLHKALHGTCRTT